MNAETFFLAVAAGLAVTFFFLLFKPSRKRHLWLLLLGPLSLSATEIRFAWDSSPTVGVTNYMVCATTNAEPITVSNALARVSVGTNLTATVTNLIPARWQFMCVAQIDGLTSEPSNIVHVEIPQPPANMRTLIPQWSATVASTNWQDVGFFRIRIER